MIMERVRGGRTTRHDHALRVVAIAEKRIRFVRLGRHVRIPESAIVESLKPGRCNNHLGRCVMTSRKRHFGSIRRRESGNYQARYRGPEGRMHSAPMTFARKSDVERWLALLEGNVIRGEWSSRTRDESRSESTHEGGSRSVRSSHAPKSCMSRSCEITSTLIWGEDGRQAYPASGAQLASAASERGAFGDGRSEVVSAATGRPEHGAQSGPAHRTESVPNPRLRAIVGSSPGRHGATFDARRAAVLGLSLDQGQAFDTGSRLAGCM